MPLESGAHLPDAEGVTELPRRETQPTLAHEERRLGCEALADLVLPRSQRRELRPQRRGQYNLLPLAARFVLALEHAQEHAPLRLASGIEHVAHVERDELVGAQPRAERHGVEHVVAEARAVLAGHL